MKKIYSILLTVVALLSIAPFAKAQEPPYILVTEGDAAGLAYSKKISPPSGGKYTITLESFVTGELHVTSQSIPADIVLVLDVSGSMAWNMSGTQSSHTTNYERINALKTAVKAFHPTAVPLYNVRHHGKLCLTDTLPEQNRFHSAVPFPLRT